MGCSGVQGVWAAAVRRGTPILAHFHLWPTPSSRARLSFVPSPSQLQILDFSPHPFPVFKFSVMTLGTSAADLGVLLKRKPGVGGWEFVRDLRLRYRSTPSLRVFVPVHSVYELFPWPPRNHLLFFFKKVRINSSRQHMVRYGSVLNSCLSVC